MATKDLVVTHSLLKQFKSCQRATLYKHVELLGPKVRRSKPLQRGIWFHELLEAKYKGERVSDVHAANCEKFERLLDEEKEILGDLPNEMRDIYRAYQWHYGKDAGWKICEVEIKIEAELPNGMQGQGKADMLIEDEHGDLWAVDHKTHDRLPTWDFRLLDQQCPYYIWMFRRNNIPVRGFIWNYIVPTAPQPLKFKLDGGLYKRQPPVQDYPTVLAALTDEQKEREDVQAALQRLKALRFDPDKPQISPMFRREFLEPTAETIDLVIDDIAKTGDRYRTWKFVVEKEREWATRTVSRGCEWCDYRNLCVGELTGLNVDGLRRREYTQKDPFDYYEVKP